MYQICDSLKIDYDKVIEYATLDERLGTSHWNVPGHDGDFGFGGHCFPKDLSALLHITEKFDFRVNLGVVVAGSRMELPMVWNGTQLVEVNPQGRVLEFL